MKQINKDELERTIKNGQRVFLTLIIVIVAMAIGMSLFSCSKDERSTVNCNCGTVESSETYSIEITGGTHQFSVMQVKNNCSGINKQVQRDGFYNVGTQICNY